MTLNTFLINNEIPRNFATLINNASTKRYAWIGGYSFTSWPTPTTEHANTWKWCWQNIHSDFLQVGPNLHGWTHGLTKQSLALSWIRGYQAACTRQENLICHLEMKTVNSRTAIKQLETQSAPKGKPLHCFMCATVGTGHSGNATKDVTSVVHVLTL